MYDTEGNEHHICIADKLLDYRQLYLHIHLKQKKPVLSYRKQKVAFFWKKTLLKNLRIKFLTCFKHQTNITVAQLF